MGTQASSTSGLRRLRANKDKGRSIKRAFDLVIAVGHLVLLAPLLVVVALLILATMGRPIMFRQERTGKNGEPFSILKFRTMSNAVDANGQLLPDALRQSVLGNLLRRLSIDELPALINVLKGEMSIVGPRPFIHDYHDLYNERQRRRFEVPVGITGLAQVSGRNAISWEDKFELDVVYVETWSLLLDLQILARTLRMVIGQRGISEEGLVTASRFQGSPPWTAEEKDVAV